MNENTSRIWPHFVGEVTHIQIVKRLSVNVTLETQIEVLRFPILYPLHTPSIFKNLGLCIIFTAPVSHQIYISFCFSSPSLLPILYVWYIFFSLDNTQSLCRRKRLEPKRCLMHRLELIGATAMSGNKYSLDCVKSNADNQVISKRSSHSNHDAYVFF